MDNHNQSKDDNLNKHFMNSVAALKVLDPKKYISNYLIKNVRPNERALDSYRPISIHTSILPLATCGSALVNCGNTRILAGTTLQIGTPSSASSVDQYPDYGEVEIQFKMNSLCHPKLDTNGRVINSRLNAANSLSEMLVIESWLQRHFAHLDILDLKQLCISSGKAAWKIQVHLNVLNHDGNLYDSSLLALLVALSDIQLPQVIFSQKDNQYSIVEDGVSKKLHLKNMPMSTTIGFVQLHTKAESTKKKVKFIVDPDEFEECILDGIMHIIMNEDGSKLLAYDKVGGSDIVVDKDSLHACFALASRQAKITSQVFKCS